jgi:uncharacterized membrane protein YedE/YeeE
MTMPSVAAFVSGLIFGIGLLVSGMAQPAKVLNFLDLAGRWDPSLLFVMIGALIVVSLGYAFARRRRPLLADKTAAPSKTAIDRNLVTGAILFGVGWGLAGLCPGPALTDLATLHPGVLLFVAAMVAGMLLHDRVWNRMRDAPDETAPSPAGR